MSEQDTMRLVAEVIDKYSKPVKEMNDALRKLGESMKSTHDKGKRDAIEHSRAFVHFRQTLVDLKTKGLDIARPAMEDLGIAAFGTAGAVSAAGAAAVKAALDWSNFGQQMTFANRASGLTIDTIRGLAAANEQFGGTQEDTIAKLKEFGAHMNELARRSPMYLNMWKALGGVKDEQGRTLGTLWDVFGKQLIGKSREEQLKIAMEMIPKIRDPDQRRRVLNLLGLPENWEYLTTQEMQRMRQVMKQFSANNPFDAKSAYEAQQAWAQVRTTLKGIWNDIGQSTGKGMFDALKEMRDHPEKYENLRKIFVAIGNSVKSWDAGPFKSDLQDIATIADGIKAVYDYFKGIASGKIQLGDADTNYAQQYAQRNQPASPPGKGAEGGQSWWSMMWAQLFGSATDAKAQDNIRKGTAQGFLDALRDMGNKTLGAGGYATPISYETGGGGGGYGYGGGGGGTTPRSMGKDSDGSSVPLGADGAPSGTLAQQRAKFAKELNDNPALMRKVMRIAANEQGSNPLGTQGIIESMMNRAIVRGTSLAAQARWHQSEGGYYDEGNMGRGALENPRTREILERSLYNALMGSNAVRGATDNSSGALAAKERITGMFRFLRGIHGESFFAPGRSEPSLARRWDQWHENMDAQIHRERLRAHRPRSPSDASMIRSNFVGGGQRSLDGSAHLKIDLNGFPRGTRTAASADGIFKSVTLSRGIPMVLGSEEA